MKYSDLSHLEPNNKLQLHEMELEESKMKLREDFEYLSDGKNEGSHFYAEIVYPDSIKKQKK